MDVHEARDYVRSLKDDLSSALPTIREFNDALTMSIALSRRFGITGPIMDVVAMFQQARLAADMFYRSAMLAYTVSGPIGWVLAGGTFLLGTLTMVDAMQIRRPHY